MRVFRVCLSICVCASVPFGFEGGMWDLIVFIPNRCFPIYFACLIEVASKTVFTSYVLYR